MLFETSFVWNKSVQFGTCAMTRIRSQGHNSNFKLSTIPLKTQINAMSKHFMDTDSSRYQCNLTPSAKCNLCSTASKSVKAVQRK